MESQILRAAGNENKERENKSSDSESGGKGVEVTVGDSQITRFTSVTTIELSQTHDNNIDDTVILRRDPATRRSFINKSAYAKLHRTLSPGRSNGGNINSLKEKYESKSDLIDVKNETYNNKTIKTETAKARSGPEPAEDGDGSKPASHVKLDEETVQSLKNKYSPGGFGYPKAPPKPSKLPVPKPRNTVKSQIIFPAHRDSLGENVSSRYSLDVGAKSSSKDENANDVRRKNSSSSGEFISIITRSESEASVDKFEKELSLFTMEGKPREKKKGSSFRRIFSGRLFGRDKKKKEEEKSKVQYRENAAASDNLQNEANTFNRQSPYRHTTDGSVTAKPRENRVARSVSERFGQPKKNHITKDMEEKYAQMHITQFNNIKQTFEHSESPNMPTTQGYVRMDTPMMKNNPGPISYSNMPNIKKFIDTSSSASTLESDKSNVYLSKERTERGESDKNKNDSPNTVSVRFDEVKKDVRETPPRAQELRQDVRLVNPKALIPINSERPLPNPYQNDKIASSPERVRHPSSFTDNTEMTKKQARPRFEETYGTVFDSVEEYKRENDKTAERRALSNSGDLKKPPRSPSLESSKLKLPSNREIVPLSPRIRSPIPHNDVSTEKIIATELLKPVRTPPSTRKNMSTKFSSPSHQKLEVEIDYPENISDKPTPKNTSGTSTYALSAKPPVSPQTPFGRSPESNSSAKRSTSRNSPSFDSSPRRLNQTYPATESAEKIIYLGYDNGLVSFPADQKKVTTDVLIHANASPTPSALLQNRSLSPARPLSVRSPTPVDTGSSPSVTGSPQKEGMRRSVEAYYWKEIKKLKEQENYDLYLYQMQMMPYGYAEDPIAVRRTRSLSPTTHRNSGRRSLSLPRERRPTNAPTETTESPYGRMQPPQPIPEGRAIVNQQPYRRDVTYGRVQEFQPNFRRNAPERRTIEVTTARNAHTLYKPIFKRGSLTTPLQEFPDDLQNKKVSFSNSRADVQSLQSWPTRNGYTQSPPQRRIDGNRRSTVDDDVFLPPTSQPFSDNNDFYVYANKQSNVLYRPSQNDNVYYRSNQNMTSQNQELPPQYAANPAMRHRQDNGQPYEEYAAYGDADAHSVLLRPSSVQPQEPLYGQRQLVPRRMSYDNANSTVGPRRFREPQYVGQRQRTAPPERDPRYGFKREIIVTDEIFGQFGGYVRQTDEDVYFQNTHIQNPVYSSKQSMVEPVYGRSGTKQVFVRDKVCDIYGQINDRDSPGVSSPPRHMQKTGVLLGELQRSPGSPSVVRQSYAFLPNERFVRNSRLTASANDIAYRRYENGDPRYRGGGGGGDVGGDPRLSHHQDGGGQAPTRPLPPVPVRLSRHDAAKTPEDDDDIKRGTSIGAKNKKRSFFEEEWNADGKSGRGISGSDSGRSDNESGEVRGRSRNTRRDDPRRHTLGGEQQYLTMAGQGGPLSRTMDLEGQPRGYPPPSNAMLFDDDPGIMSEVETSSTGFRRGGKQRSSLPVVRTPSKTLERPLGLVFLQYRNETKRALLPNEITSIDTVKALFVRSFPKQLTMEYLDSPNVKIYIHDSSKDMFYELEDLRSHLREIRDRSVLRLFESADVSGGLPMAGIGIAGGVGHFEDPSYFSEPEFDSEYQHQHIHKSKMFHNGDTVRQVDVPSFSGCFGILAEHVPTLAILRPGVVTVFEDDGSERKIFVSSGTVTVNADSTVQILAEEAHPIENLDSTTAKEMLSKAQSLFLSATTDEGSGGKNAPYYMGSTASLPRGATLLRTYSPAVAALPAERMKPLPTGAPPKPQRAYSTGASRASDGPPRPPDRFVPFQRPANPLYTVPDGYMSSPERGSRYEDPYYSQYATRSGSITPVIDEEISDTELLDESYSLYGVKLPPGGGPRVAPRSPFPPPASVPPYDATRLRVENMERQLANLTGLVQKALTQPATASHLQVPGRESYRGDEFDKNSSSSSASLPDDTYLRSDSKAPKLGKSGCHKSVSFEKSVSFSDEPPDMNSPKQHSPQHAADTKPAKPAIKSSTLPRTSSQERDRLKPAPPPKPASLSPGQYDSRIYRDLQLTPEMYNQLRGLQKKAKDLRAEVRNLRRMSQAQAHSVKETIRDTFIKIRAMLLAGGEQVWQAGMDQERVRLTREEDLYKQEMLRLETDLGDLESTVEELRGNVINRKTRVNMSDVENMALVLSKSSKTVADLKLRFPGLQDGMKAFLSTEMEKVMREEKFLKEEPERLESALRRCKKLTGTLVTLKRLASVQEQRLPCSNSSDGRLSPGSTETPPVTPSSTHSKPPAAPRVGALVVGGDCSPSDGGQRPENALDALLDELQTFSKPHSNGQAPQDPPEPPPAIPAKGSRPPQMSEIGRKGSMDSASFLPAQNLSVSTATGSLRRLHSYPSGSDTDNSPPIQPLLKAAATKPPIPERNAELLQHAASGKRVPPPPPPRTSSKSPLASPTSPSLPPRSPAAALQHIQNVQNMVDRPMSQFEQATQNLGLQTLRRNVPGRSSVKDKSQTLPRNLGSNLQLQAEPEAISASNSSSCESVNSQDGSKRTRKEELEQRHQELLKKQKALQEQYARLQQLQRGNNTLAVVPPAPDQLLKKTGSESNLLQKMGLQLSTSQITGSLTNLPNTSAVAKSTGTGTGTGSNPANPSHNPTAQQNNVDDQGKLSNASAIQTNKVYETDIL